MANILEIILRAVKQGSGFKDTQKDVNDLGKAMGGLNKILGMAGLAIGAKELIDFGKASVNAAIESAQAEAALQAALVSSGQATAEYKAQLIALATELENTTNFTDEEILSVQALLVGFQNIGQDVIPGATQAVANMAQMMGGTANAAKALGIALDAPGQAGDRLRRQGILLNEQQQAQIDTMVQVGNIAGAQGVVIDAVNQKFGGQAEAARNAAGGMQDWVVATSRLQEEFGKLLLVMGEEGGVGGAATGLVDTLTEGATVWTANVDQIGLFIDALNRANETLNNTGAAAAASADEVGLIQQIQKGWEIILLNTANAAIESTVGWDQLAESYGVVQEEAAQAEQATREANQAIAETPLATGASAQALDALAARWQGLANAQRTMTGGRDVLEEMAGGSTFTTDEAAAFAEQQKEKERLAKQTVQTISKAFDEVGQEIASTVASAVGGAISGVDQDVIGQLLGIDTAEANAGEAVRRMAAVAAGGISNEWAPALAAQLTGVKDATAQAFVQAFQAGDSGALQGAARQLALAPIVDMFDANLIAAQVEQKLRTQQLTQQLNDKVNALLGEKGLPAVAAVSQQVGQAATDTGVATSQVQQSAADMGVSAEVSAAKIKAAMETALPAIDILNARFRIMAGLIERVNVLATGAAGSIAGMNPPAAPGPTGMVVVSSQ